MQDELRKWLLFHNLMSQVTQVTVTAVTSEVSTADASQFDFPGLNLPAGRLLISVGARDSAATHTITSVLVNGQAASLVPGGTLTSGASDLNRTSIYEYVNVSAQTNATIQVNTSVGVDRCGIDVVVTNGTVTDVATSAASPSTGTVTPPKGGAVYGYVFGVGGTDATWTGATEHTDEVVETTVTHTAAAAQVPAGGDTTLTSTWSTAITAGSGGVFVALSP